MFHSRFSFNNRELNRLYNFNSSVCLQRNEFKLLAFNSQINVIYETNTSSLAFLIPTPFYFFITSTILLLIIQNFTTFMNVTGEKSSVDKVIPKAINTSLGLPFFILIKLNLNQFWSFMQ